MMRTSSRAWLSPLISGCMVELKAFSVSGAPRRVIVPAVCSTATRETEKTFLATLVSSVISEEDMPGRYRVSIS